MRSTTKVVGVIAIVLAISMVSIVAAGTIQSDNTNETIQDSEELEDTEEPTELEEGDYVSQHLSGAASPILVTQNDELGTVAVNSELHGTTHGTFYGGYEGLVLSSGDDLEGDDIAVSGTMTFWSPDQAHASVSSITIQFEGTIDHDPFLFEGEFETVEADGRFEGVEIEGTMESESDVGFGMDIYLQGQVVSA